jgi:hypothetical protein
MQITITHTRGVDGSMERLGPAEANEKIEAKLAEIGFFYLPERMPGGEGNDVGELAVEVVDGERHHHVSFSEISSEAREAGLFDLLPLVSETGAVWRPIPVSVGGGDDAGNAA